jgi:subtilisin family serine protease
VDTGVDYTHPDLKNRVLKELGYDFVNNDGDAMDDNWHGTHVAGIIAAEANNGQGISGIAGPLNVKIIPVKVADKDGQTISGTVAKGMQYAVDHGADIINLSIGFESKDEIIEQAICYAGEKGVLVVASSGNNNDDCDEYSPSGDSGVYTVGAITSSYERASFSNYGDSLQIVAPGVGILSTVPGGKYGVRDGTSMAAPIVTAVAAILKAEDPRMKPDQIIRVLNETARDLDQKGKDSYTGYGLVDANEAVAFYKNSMMDKLVAQ